MPDTPNDLSNAKSITLIIHGVGSATTKRLLTAARKGYVASGLEGNSEPQTLAECPALSLQSKGTESLVLHTSEGPHFLIALPWADRRIRLSTIAKWSAVALVILTALAAAAFAFREPLDSLTTWLLPWSHRIRAYLIILGISVTWYVLRPGKDKREFKAPSIFILALPSLLSMLLIIFLDATWSWIPVALLVVVLWLLPTVTVTRCFRVAPTVGWRLALACLIVALALPAAGLIGLAREFSMRSAALEEAGRKYFFQTGGRAVPPQLQPRPDKLPPSTKTVEDYLRDPPPGKTENNVSAGQEVQKLQPRPDKLPPSTKTVEDYLRDPPPSRTLSNDLTEEDISAIRKELAESPFSPFHALEFPIQTDEQSKATRDRLYARWKAYSDRIRFSGQLELAVVMVALCLLTMAFSWLLDFAIDVLYYGGHPRHGTSLIDGTVSAIRWLHTQSPNAPIVVVGHSLGSVIAAQAVCELASMEPHPPRVVLVTLGSPLNYLNRLFPNSCRGPREISHAISERVRWINLWRRYDPIGKALDKDDKAAVQYCVGTGGHANYWSDGNVWRAVARETLGSLPLDREVPGISPGAVETCIFERRLGTLVFLAITALAISSVGIWFMNP